MKIDDFVASAISNWPLLYLKKDYSASKFSVLHHAFITLGNGMEWADTGNPETGGYLVDPKYSHFEETDEYVRVKDPDYGAVTFKLDDRFWKEEVWDVAAIDFDFIDRLKRDLDDYKPDKPIPKIGRCITAFASDILPTPYLWQPGMVFDSEKHTHMAEPLWAPGEDNERENPYPYFEKRHSCFWEIDPSLIQKDWLEDGIGHLEYWVKYFNDPERYSKYHYIITAEELRKYIEDEGSFGELRKTDREKWLQRVRSDDGYGFKEFNGKNYEEMAEYRNTREIRKCREFLSDTLARLEPWRTK